MRISIPISVKGSSKPQRLSQLSSHNGLISEYRELRKLQTSTTLTTNSITVTI
ncbi:hypothetical protein [Brunnivagina elsteri]|uniref:hypothetical protein n=1 Tax=Brunnivagina elsteri TaxID=1247191 RepID=UPI001B804AE7|nr:hypothetical protein [Calothrix elsteri]